MLNLFSNQPGFEEYEKQANKLSALKRGCYNKKPKTIDPYLELQNIYTYLAGFFERPNFPEKDDEVVFLDGFRLSINVYEPEIYEYEGNTYFGESFIEAQAELEGTQHFKLAERLELHRKVQGCLRAYDTLEVAYNKVKPEIVRIQKNYKKREDGGWRKLLLG